MVQEYLIGRCPDSSVKIPGDRTAVSTKHLKIYVDDSGQWKLEDLGSSNGTYIKDEEGHFQQIYTKVITEDTVIRLGGQGHNSFTFWAHQAVEPEENYAYEFGRLKKLLAKQQEEEEELEKHNSRNMTIVKLSSPLALGLCVIAQVAIPRLGQDPNLNLWISRGVMGIAPFIMGVFFGINTKQAKSLRQKRQRVLVCPKCSFPISEFDIQNRQCSRCKAH